jgi:hypothetical protein
MGRLLAAIRKKTPTGSKAWKAATKATGVARKTRAARAPASSARLCFSTQRAKHRPSTNATMLAPVLKRACEPSSTPASSSMAAKIAAVAATERRNWSN